MKIKKTTYPGWNCYPVYHCRSYDDYKEVSNWMAENGVKEFLLSSGVGGYVFMVKSNITLFTLRWHENGMAV